MEVYKTIKIFLFITIIIIGAIVTVAIDHLIGVSFTNVAASAVVVHKVTYMVWGGCLAGLVKWLSQE